MDSACGNDFIGKACDIFSPLVCGSWRRLEVYVEGTPSSRARPEPSGPVLLPSAGTAPAPAPLPLAAPAPARAELLGCFFLIFFFF